VSPRERRPGGRASFGEEEQMAQRYDPNHWYTSLDERLPTSSEIVNDILYTQGGILRSEEVGNWEGLKKFLTDDDGHLWPWKQVFSEHTLFMKAEDDLRWIYGKWNVFVENYGEENPTFYVAVTGNDLYVLLLTGRPNNRRVPVTGDLWTWSG
jgi:hypothetical protein